MLKFLLFILSSTCIFSSNIWEEVYNGNGIPISIECPDSNICFILTSGSPTRIYKITDAGKSWELLNTIKELEVQDMSIPDSNNFFISFNKSILYKSSDGGDTFEKLLMEGIYTIQYIEMFDKDMGVMANLSILITKNGWDTYEYFKIDSGTENFRFSHPKFINDSILLSIVYNTYALPAPYFLLRLNVNTLNYQLNFIDSLYSINDLFILDDKNMFACGKSHSISGGSGRDAIYKSTDGGQSWRRVLDLYYHNKLDTNSPNPFSLQSIAFKDSLTGIAVGQFGKFVYTYDGGESWTYENNLHPRIIELTPPTMLVRYMGTTPIVATFNSYFYTLLKDNLAPGAEHKYSISGRVWEGDRGQEGVCVALGHRVTMTDKEGYYHFSMLNQGDYKVKVVNKYGPIEKEFGSYEPFSYTPLEYNIELTSDTTGFDFNAEDLRTFYKAEGYIVDDKGQGIPDIFLRTGSSTTTTEESGRFEFPKIESRLTFDVIPYSDVLAFSPTSHRINLITGDTTDLLFTATPATSVWESANNTSLILHPNPASEYIFIQPSEGYEPSEGSGVKIYNTLGECVIELPDVQHLGDVGHLQRIDVSNLPTGLYFVRFGDIFEKFMVIR